MDERSQEQTATSMDLDEADRQADGHADVFQVLAPTANCTAAFSTSPVLDEFALVRFAPLKTAPDTSQGTWSSRPVVLPRDVVDPKLMAVVAVAHPNLPLSILKGGAFPFNPGWDKERQAPPGEVLSPRPIFQSADQPDEPAPPATAAPDAVLLESVPAPVADAIVADASIPRFDVVLQLPYRQRWELVGYLRGAMVNSIALAPQEETTIEVFTWDRTKLIREETVSIEQETALETSFTDKDSMEVIKEMSRLSDWKIGVSGGVTIPVQGVPVSLQAGFDQKEELRILNRATHQRVSEAVRKGSSRMRATRQTKVTESREFGREDHTTRKVRNANVVRTLHLDYFEVLAQYRVTTELDLEQARVCILVPNPIADEIDRRFLLTHEGSLRESLMSPATYTPGFDASRKLGAWERLCSVRHASCEGAPATPGPQAPTSPDSALLQVVSAMRAARQAIAGLQAATPDSMISLANDVARWFDMLWRGPSDPERKQWEQAWADAKPPYHRWLYRRIGMELLAPRFWDAAQRFAQEDEKPETAERFLLAADPQVIDVLNIAALQIRGLGKVAEVVGELAQRGLLNPLPLVQNAAFEDAGLDNAFRALRNAVESYRTALQTPAPAPAPEAGAVAAEPDGYGVREIAEAQVAEAALLAHVRANESYYRQAIWQRMDPDDRYALLSIYGNLTTYVDNEVVGFVGKQAAMPYKLRFDTSLKSWFKANVTDNPELAAPQELKSVTVPTRAVTMETRLGQCDAAEEFVMRHRELDLKHRDAEVNVAVERVAQEKLETQRYAARLAQKQPLLDDPDPNQSRGAIRVELTDERDGPATP